MTISAPAKVLKLEPYQLNAIAYAKKLKKCGLFLKMGMGKTTSSLTVASEFLAEKTVSRVLVVAPLRVANTVWKQEGEKWPHLRHLTIGVCTGTPINRKKILAGDYDVVVINRENISWLVNIDTLFDMVIVDESSSFKNHATKRFKSLRHITSHCNSVILLSGTPSPNGYTDLWAQIFLLDNGKMFGKNITAFRNEYCTDIGHMYSHWVVKESAKAIIKEKLSHICISMSTEDYLTLPEMIYLNEFIELPPAVMKIYKRMKNDFFISIGDEIFEAVNSAVLANKLLQLSSGTIYGENREYSIVHQLKIDALKDIVQDNPTENFLVAYNYVSDLERIQMAFPDAVLLSKSGKELEEWNKGNIRMLLAYPASSGYGLNAQWGGSVVVWFGLSWALDVYDQFNARLHRRGQGNTVKIIHIMAKDTIDERVLSVLRDKSKTQKDIISALKYD